MNLIAIALVWAGYCIIHSFMISIRFTQRLKEMLHNYYAFYRIFYVIVSFILLYPVFYYTAKWSTPVIFHYSGFMNYVRYALSALAILIFIKAFFIDYDLLSFFGIRQAMQFGKSEVNVKGSITKSGLLGIVRHPMYFAVIIYLWCQTFRISDIVANTVLTAYIFIGTMLEEQKLVLEFGDEYLKYKQEVPMLIPFTKFK